jgi:hypothetical protein
MEPELEQQLHSLSKKRLIQLLQELATRHPILLSEMTSILEDLTDMSEDGQGEASEDWDFSGDEEGEGEGQDEDAVESIGDLQHAASRWSLLPALDTEAYRQRIEDYATRLKQGVPVSAIASDLAELLIEAETRAEYSDFQGALSLYALVLDERLREHSPALTPILDKAISGALPAMETVLSEASSNAMFDEAAVTLSPLLSTAVRHEWLKRLFALWLKHLDEHGVEEDFPRIMLNVAWSEDFLLLRNLVQGELQRYAHNEHSNIVDITQEYRARTLEKFMKELVSG